MPVTSTKRDKRITYDQAFSLNGNIPPQAVNLEELVLGALMLDQAALINSIELLHTEYFYKPENQAVFRAIRKLFEQSQPVDIYTVVERLRLDGELEMAGGSFAVAKLTENVVSAAHIDYHIRVLSEKYIQREMIRISTETIRDAYDETTDVVNLLDQTEQRLMDINDKNFRSDYRPVGDFVDLAIDQVEEAGKKETGLTGLASGFVGLDRKTAGFQPGTLIILAARPAMGKTACAMSMARNMALDFKKPVAFFSLEMSGQELAMRLISSEARIEGDKLKKGRLAPYEKEQLKVAAQKLSAAPLYIDDTPQLTIFELRAKARRLKQRFDIQMIFIDYLQLMSSGTSENRNGNREQEISMISRQLKALSKELEIPVLAMSQLSRAVENRVGNKPQLSDLRESGAIEQDADIVMFIYRPEYYGIMEDNKGSTAGMADLIIAKHRSGEVGEVRMRFVSNFVRFENPSEIAGLDAAAAGALPQNTSFDQQSGTMIVDSKMNEDAGLMPDDGDVPF